jgi:hypothetical protein
MSIDTAIEASDRYQQTSARVATERLLERLREHHDYSVCRMQSVPMQEPNIIEVAPEPSSLPTPARKPLSEVVSEIIPGPAPVTIDRIQRAVCKYFDITRADLIGDRRTADVVLPRHVAMYLCRELTVRSHLYIGRAFGGRDHTVPIHACKKISDRINHDSRIANAVAALTAQLAPPVMEAAE